MSAFLKILIVDDEEINQEILSTILAPHYSTVLAASGEQALKCALHPNSFIDLILLDINMPGMRGYEVCRRLKTDDRTRDIPIIFVTALDCDASEAKGLAFGAVDFITKPINKAIVLARVRTHLELSLTHNQLKQQNRQLREAARQIEAAAQLREAVRQQEEMDRIMRHDLKGPLSAIIAVPGLIEEVGTLNEAQKALMQSVESSGYRLLDMINRSLDMHKMELGVYTFRAMVVDIQEVLQHVAAELNGLSSNRGITLSIQLVGQNVEEKSAFLIVGEELLCHSMLSNLIKNAVEAAPRNSTILVMLENQPACIQICIHNKGCVSASIRHNFFEKYATSGKKGGTGLGTYSARLIVDLHGGHISLDSESDPEGTIVTVQLRLAEEATMGGYP